MERRREKGRRDVQKGNSKLVHIQCKQWQLLRTLYDGGKMMMVLVPKWSIVTDAHHKPGQLGEVLWGEGGGSMLK